jgi:hypothetical protein
MNHVEARKLVANTAIWYFQNNIDLTSQVPLINKNSSSKPKFSDEIWAKLMTEAIVSFSQGLENKIGNRKAKVNRANLEAAINLVGADAFRDIAFLVSAAAYNQPVDTSVDQAFQQMQGPGGEGTEFTGVEGLSGLIATNADAKAYGQASQIIMAVEGSAPNQGLYHESAQKLQTIAKTPGLSKPFAMALSSVGAEYMKAADELTRQSGQGQQPGMGVGTGVSGLPTGVRIGLRNRVILARKRIIRELLNG